MHSEKKQPTWWPRLEKAACAEATRVTVLFPGPRKVHLLNEAAEPLNGATLYDMAIYIGKWGEASRLTLVPLTMSLRESMLGSLRLSQPITRVFLPNSLSRCPCMAGQSRFAVAILTGQVL